MEGRICRDSVCTEAACELRYMQDLSDLLLYLLLPQNEFEAGPVRSVVDTIIKKRVLVGVGDPVSSGLFWSDPDIWDRIRILA
jgi:PXA domain